MSSWDYQFHGLEPSKVSHRQFPCDPGRRLQATQLAEIKLPCLDVVHGSGWLPGTRADDLATASLGTCNILIPVGYTQPECHKTSSLSRKHLYKENIGKHHLSNLDNTLAKTSEISFQEGVAVQPLLQLPSTSHLDIPSKQTAQSNATTRMRSPRL